MFLFSWGDFMDERIIKLAKILVHYSARVKKGESVQIVSDANAAPLVTAVYEEVVKAGAYPRLHVGIDGLAYIFYKNAQEHQLKHFPEVDMFEIKKTDAIIYIDGSSNKREMSSIEPKKMAMRRKVLEPISKYRVKHTKWVITLYPTHAYAQDADMSLSEFQEFVYGATNQDWEKISKQMTRKQSYLQKCKTIRIRGKDTDISMSVKGMKWVLGNGRHNMPCGEIFTAPVPNSVEGYITYDYPAVYSGKEVDGIKLEFRNGKVVRMVARKNEDFLKQMISMDAGACYLGEFGIGTNYGIRKFIKNILFDEKIGGTIHLALGQAYEECNGKNKSALHWDMIKDLRQGGEIIANGKIIQKNGKFRI